MSCPIKEKSSSQSKNNMLYGDYLELDKILTAQRMLSAEVKGNHPEHDEHLFIIIHQTYELWFKQIIYELDLTCGLFNNVEELNHSEVIKRLNRIVMILKLLVDQVLILETMTSMDFLAFRDVLDTASGFQSVQFRAIEYKLGLKPENRTTKFNQSYTKVLCNDQNAINDINKSLNSPSLLQQTEKWLEQIPHLEHLWAHYKTAIETKILTETNSPDTILANGDTSHESKVDKTNDTAIKRMREQYATIFDLQLHEALLKCGERKLSLKALQGAIIISLYKDYACFATSHQILMLLVDIDSMLCRWRYNHVLMVHRMIGSYQVGTGGSSGYQYLRSTLSDRYKPFVDLSNLTTFLISKKHLLPLTHLPNSRNMPENIANQMVRSSCNHNEDSNHDESHGNGYEQSHPTKRLSNVHGKTSCGERKAEKAKKYNEHACEDCVMESTAFVIPESKEEQSGLNCVLSEVEKKGIRKFF